MTALEQALLMLKHDVYDVQRSTINIKDATTANVVRDLAQTVEKLIELIIEVGNKRP